MSLLTLAAAIALVALPSALLRGGLRLRPSDWARVSAGALAAGVLLGHAALGSLAFFTLLQSSGLRAVSDHLISLGAHLAPGGPVVGVLAALTAILQVAVITRTVRRVRDTRAQLEMEPGLGDHFELDEFEVVVVPTGKVMAFSNPLGGGQIIVSKELLRVLEPEETAAVLLHEAAHLRRRHDRYLWVAAVAEAALPLPLTRRTAALLRQSIEHWADEDTASSAPARSVLRQALRRLAALDCGATVDDRISALTRSPGARPGAARVAACASACGLVLAAFLPLGDAAGHVLAALTTLGGTGY